jgi:HD-GYP domain-containing protein (c-di-GMP phosphodiesterase class II)
MEQLLANQRKTPSTSTSPSANAQLQESIRLLSELAKHNSAQPVAAQPDPALQTLIATLIADRKEGFKPFDSRNITVTILLFILLLMMALFVVISILGLRRSRRQAQHLPDPNAESRSFFPIGTENTIVTRYLPESQSSGLLEYSQGTTLNSVEDSDLTRSLIRADHLQKMYQAARKGTLSWETIRNYIDDLDKSLRVDILRIVEAKLDSGALLTGEAALPVLFPFLTDFDDYLSRKAEELAKKAAVTGRASRSSIEENRGFAITSLTDIPKKLSEITNGRDRSMVTAQIAFAIAKKIGLSTTESTNIYKGALAHDAGYLMLEAGKIQRIISKGEITEDEWNFMQSHVENGIAFFGAADIPPVIRDAVLFHHERLDGSGYPKGVKGEGIPLVGQIVGLAETFSTLIVPRAYRDRHEVNQALAIIRDDKNRFDKDLVIALERIVKTNEADI